MKELKIEKMELFPDTTIEELWKMIEESPISCSNISSDRLFQYLLAEKEKHNERT